MANKKKKRFGCAKFLFILVLAYFVCAVIHTVNNQEPASQDANEPTKAPVVTATTVSPTATPTAAPTASPTPLITPEPTEEPEAIPALAGSYAYDFIYSLEEYGIEKPKTQYFDWGYQWQSDIAEINDCFVQYLVCSNKKHEVAYISVNAWGDMAERILPFCATLPYDGNNSEEAYKWVKDNIASDEVTTKIGDAVYTIYQSKTVDSVRLLIEADGYVDWCLDQIE